MSWIGWTVVALGAVTLMGMGWRNQSPVGAQTTRPPAKQDPLSRRDRHDLGMGYIDLVIKVVAAVAVVATLVYTADTLRQGQDALEVQREAGFNERYTKLSEMLASDDESVRVAGIYGYAQLMDDDESKIEPIVEVLSLFIRENDRKRPQIEGTSLTREKLKDGEYQQETCAAGTRNGPLDVTAAMKTLTAPNLGIENLDLSGADLSQVELSGISLKGADLTAADLSYSRLENVDLSRAQAQRVTATGSCLIEADLSSGDFKNSDFHRSAFFDVAWLRTGFYGASLKDSIVVRGSMTDTTFAATDMDGTSLSSVHIEASDFSSAKLTGINILDGSVSSSDFSESDMDRAFIANSDMTEVNFSKASMVDGIIDTCRFSLPTFDDANVTNMWFATPLNRSKLWNADNYDTVVIAEPTSECESD